MSTSETDAKRDFDVKGIAPLVEKYSGSGPRYTSYPTAVEFSSEFGEEQWSDYLTEDSKQWAAEDPLALYVHLPFCHTLCYFCACNKVITRDDSVVDPYLDAVISEIETYKNIVGSEYPIAQLHWGGGTPNYLSPKQMARLYNALKDAFPNHLADADISIEVDPRTTTKDHIIALADLGFNRISMGVQDFDPHVQKTINRIQPYEQTKQLVDWAREFNFDGVNIDLIYGLPEQSLEGFTKTLELVNEIRPDRLALYGYAHVKWLHKVQKSFERLRLPTPAERLELMLHAIESFSDSGYEFIGIDHFALPEDSLSKALANGQINRNFMGYSTHLGTRVLAFGASSISIFPGAFAQNEKDVEKYKAAIAMNGNAVTRGLACSVEDRFRGSLIETIMCAGHLDIPDFERKWNINFSEYFAEELCDLASLEEDGLVTLTSDAIDVTDLGRLFCRNIAMPFDAYLNKHQRKQVFSQSV